jgi:hypothetical protein
MLRQSGNAILDGACRTPYGKLFVAAPSFNMKVVNRSTPDLFPAACMLKKSSIRREKWSVVPLSGPPMIDHNPLKTNSVLSLTDCPLNRI